MKSFERSWICGAFLVVGSLLVGVAGLFHPVLTGEGAAQLASIASAGGWRLIHWSISFGYVIAVAGLSSMSSIHAASRGAGAARIGASLAVLGYAVSLVGVLFMLGASGTLAQEYTQAAPTPPAEDIVFLYDALHPFALGALRIGAFAVSLGIAALGWAVIVGRLWRAWVGWLGFGVGVVGALVAVVLSEHSPGIVSGIGLAAVWQLVVGLFLVIGSDPRMPVPAS
jgi:hypothetical protein